MADAKIRPAAENDLTKLREFDSLTYEAIKSLVVGTFPDGATVIENDDPKALDWDDDDPDEPDIALEELEPCHFYDEQGQSQKLRRLRVNTVIVYYLRLGDDEDKKEWTTLNDCIVFWVKRYDVPVCSG